MKQIYTASTLLSGLACPKCGSIHYRKHGTDRDIQRYRCKDCGRTFKETINTPIHWIHHKKQMSQYTWTMSNRYSIRAAAQHLGISKNTSFNWRHKILSSLRTSRQEIGYAPAGITAIKLPYSQKGSKHKNTQPLPATTSVLISDARGILTIHLLQQKKKIKEIASLISNKLHASASIAPITSTILTKACRKTENKRIKHKTNHTTIASHANKTAVDLSLWMTRFNGVATKYLQQYWDWYRMETNTNSLDQFTRECFGQRQLHLYRKFQAKIL